MITKIQKLSAIHNPCASHSQARSVVYDYKDTEIVSNSQPCGESGTSTVSCL